MKIIAAVDGTRYSEAAIDALAGMNWAADTEIKILTVIPADEPAFPFMRLGAAAKTAEQHKEILEQTRVALKNLLGPKETALGCKVDYEVLQGDAKARIVEAAKNMSANMIIMGTRGNKGLESLFLGSVSQHVLNLAPCPVLIIKSDDTTDNDVLRQGYKSVLVAVDNSQYSQAAINWIKGLKWPATTKLRLVTVVQPLSDLMGAAPDAAVMVSELMLKHDATVSMAETELQKLAKSLKTSVPADKISVQVASGDPREVILQAAASCSADLIVMGSHGRTGLTKLFIGSVSQAVAVHAPCSVAIIRGVVPKGKTGELNQSGLFIAENSEELLKHYAQLSKDKDE